MRRAVFLLLSLLGSCTLGFAQLPTNVATGTITVRTSLVGASSGAALDMALRPDDPDRFFIVKQGGTINVLQNGVFEPQPYLNISSGFGLVSSGERGLLGMTFHPQFNTPGARGFGKFYTYTSETKVGNADFFLPANGPTGGSHHNVVREWTVDPAASSVTNVTTASRVLFRAANPAGIHNGGAIKFGADGMLYASLGDGGPSINSQDLNLIFGKVIRIDPTTENPPNGRYGIPTGNPFASPGIDGLDEIYAYGLRNPFRMSFDRLTGRLYLGDVGAGGVEEVDEAVSGGNYGWPYFEGTLQRVKPPKGFVSTPPLAQYSHSFGYSVIGGFIYRGTEIPELYGKYVFGDAFNFTRRYMDSTGGQVYGLRIAPGSDSLSGSLYGWGEDAAGELYALSSSGRVIRIGAVPEPGTFAFLVAAASALAASRNRARHN